jgi:hypothetical protein
MMNAFLLDNSASPCFSQRDSEWLRPGVVHYVIISSHGPVIRELTRKTTQSMHCWEDRRQGEGSHGYTSCPLYYTLVECC